jgi:DNA-directed RNA polymerase specialized sigma subunit
MICGVNPIKLPKGELAAYLSILRTHNQVLETHGSKSALSMEKFREEFLSGRLSVKLTVKEKTAIKSLTEDVKAKIVAHHIKMVQKIALHYCRSFNVTGRNRTDIVMEGLCGLMKALYAYTSQTIRFSTFSHLIVTNTLKDHFREQHNGLSPVSKRGVGLNNQIEQHRASANDSISFDRAVAELNLSDKQITEALEARCSVAPVSNVLGASPKEEQLGALLDKATVEAVSSDEMELSEAYRLCDLTELERVVMDAAIMPWHGWMVDLGREYPHENGDHRTRQHIRMVLQRVQRKVQDQYEKMYSYKHEAAVA